MKKTIFLFLCSLVALAIGQATNPTGFKVVQRAQVFWGPDSVVGKTRLRIRNDTVSLDTTRSGQSATTTGWLTITGACSKPFTIASDSNGSVRGKKVLLWHLVTVDTANNDSAIYGYRIQTRERVYNANLKQTQWTPWTNADGYNLGSGEGEYRDIFFIQRYPNSLEKFSHWTVAYVHGAVARLCPDLDISAGFDTDPAIYEDSLTVYSE